MSDVHESRAPGGGSIPPAESHELAGLVEYSLGAVVSRTLRKGETGTLTVFAFDEGQELSEHTAPFDAWVQVLDGRVELTIGGRGISASTGELVLMPGGIPHAVRAVERFKMLLIMFRN